jgi:hypothetical protein
MVVMNYGIKAIVKLPLELTIGSDTNVKKLVDWKVFLFYFVSIDMI